MARRVTRRDRFSSPLRVVIRAEGLSSVTGFYGGEQDPGKKIGNDGAVDGETEVLSGRWRGRDEERKFQRGRRGRVLSWM